MEELTFERKGKKIFYRRWADVSAPRGVVQIAHGMVEHTLRYDEVARRFQDAGYIVVADEHRGHGNTDPETLGYCAGDMFEETIEDMYFLLQKTKAEYPSLPYFLFGFSYGSFLTQAFIGRYGKDLSGAVIGGSSKNPHIAVSFGKFVSDLGCLYKGEKAPARLVKTLTFGAYDQKFADRCFLSVNPESNEKYFADPFCTYTCSYNFYRSFFGGLKKLYSKAYGKSLRRDLPLLLISGEDDAVGDMGKGVKRLYDYYKKQGCDVTMKLYPHSRHEFLNEDPARVDDIVAFLRGVRE